MNLGLPRSVMGLWRKTSPTFIFFHQGPKVFRETNRKAVMQRKPWPIIILAILQVFSPIASILIQSENLNVYPTTYLQNLFHSDSWYDLLQFFFVAPIAGFAIFAIKRWSYPVFLGSITWIALSNYDAWQRSPESIGLPVLLTCYTFNFLLVSYFLIRQVRITYYDPRIRWWESKPRYTIQASARLRINEQIKPCTVVNISEGGAFLHLPQELKPGTLVSLFCNCMGREFQFGGEVLYQVNRMKNQYGIQFIIPRKKRHQIKQLIQALEILGVQRRPVRTHWTVSFYDWMKNLFFEGTGLVPEISLAMERKNTSISHSNRHSARKHRKNTKFISTNNHKKTSHPSNIIPFPTHMRKTQKIA